MIDLIYPDYHKAPFVPDNVLSARKLICEGRCRHSVSSLST